MTDCLFCKIVAGEIPATVVHSNNRVIAFKDINPQAEVHILVVPRDHYANVAEVAGADPELVGEMVSAAGTIAADQAGPDAGYRLVFNTGADAGQTVFHAHLHLLAGRHLRAMA